MIKISIREFLKEVVCRVCIIVPIASVTPFLITLLVPQGFVRLVLTTFFTIIFTSLIILLIGISKEERGYLIQQIKNKFIS